MRRARSEAAQSLAASARFSCAYLYAERLAKIVVVSRNPKDAAVSMLHHTRNIPGFCFVGGWEQFAPLFLAGRVESGSIWEWHLGWWEAAAAHPESVLRCALGAAGVAGRPMPQRAVERAAAAERAAGVTEHRLSVK